MTDARWIDAERDITSGLYHIERAITLHESRDLSGDDLDNYSNRMAFLHAMQSGYTSMENALRRVLTILDEEKPEGPDWHAALLRRLGNEFPGSRPAMLSSDLYRSLDELRRFRHVAARTYDMFDPTQASPAVEAGKCVNEKLLQEFRYFRDTIDPPRDTPGVTPNSRS